ncbi:MAG: AAA family ATPase [Halieaceae bacterium]|nr:AAA family ATPase [Halieaceae bacterium]
MAKLVIEDKDDDTRVPFLRGILTRSLQQAGLSFSEAHKMATELRDHLDSDTPLSSSDLKQIVYKRLKDEYGPKRAERYLRPAVGIGQIMVEDDEGRVMPFSAELYRRDLETIGLTLPESVKIASKLRRHLIKHKFSQISSHRISRLTYDFLKEADYLGPAVARRWLVWRNFLRSRRPLIIVIGGTTGCGKSTIATSLANQLGIVRMQSTDLLREVMRTMMSDEEHPALHASSYEAWRHMAGAKSRSKTGAVDVPVEAGFKAQAELVSAASQAVMERARRERVSLVLEGVHAHPELAEQLELDDAILVHVLLAVLKKRKLKRRLSSRAEQASERRAEQYLENFDQIWQLQSYLLSEADRTNTPIVINDDRDQAVREIMRTVLDSLEEPTAPSPKKVFAE